MVILAVDLSEGGIIFTVISQLFTGFGIGLAQPTTGAIALQQAKSGEEGEISTSLPNQSLERNRNPKNAVKPTFVRLSFEYCI